MRWQVIEATGGAEAMALLEAQSVEAMVLDGALPDLEVKEFAGVMRMRHPVMDLLRIDEAVHEEGARSPRRNELLHALRQIQRDPSGPRDLADGTAWAHTPVAVPQQSAADRMAPGGERFSAAQEVTTMLRARNAVRPSKCSSKIRSAEELFPAQVGAEAVGCEARNPMMSVTDRSTPSLAEPKTPVQPPVSMEPSPNACERVLSTPLPKMVGQSPEMLELSRLVRLVAPRSSTVLIEGETGTGKELVAHAVHQLSRRAAKPFVVLNCAAIPESLLEAELFGHTRGAFTGAVQSRTGRIEAAHGGTLFLDEIGEMPLLLQSKVLRFLESGELQRVGDNETVRVDVRVVAATHEPLLQRTTENAFRLDLYHRLAVFPVFVPALRDRIDDLLPLAEHMLAKLGQQMPVKRLSPAAMAKLMQHNWPGNVRELEHVLERATILAEDRSEIAGDEIRF